MTNNNLEEVILKYTKNCGCMLKYCEHYLELRDTIEDILTQKDQEHKAELEMIKWKIQEQIEPPHKHIVDCKNFADCKNFTNYERWHNMGIEDAISILDSHINKLSTE